mgnify:CR=1 FL=1
MVKTEDDEVAELKEYGFEPKRFYAIVEFLLMDR